MRLFTYYMAGRFFKPFLFGLGLFSLLIFLGDMFDKMNQLVKTRAPFGVILQYLWLGVPYWTVRIVPMATLLATLMALIGFIQSGEWIAAQASGFETKRFWRPLLGCALIVTALSFIAQETVLPACYRRSQILWRDRIHPQWEWDKYLNITLAGGPDEFVQAAVFTPKDGRLERPLFEKLGPEGIEHQLDAKAALWDGIIQRWVFYEGVERRFGPLGVREKAFEKIESNLKVPPRQLIPRSKNPDEMSLRELRRYAEKISFVGGSPREMRVAFHQKISYPFTNFVLCALGIPVALRFRRFSKVISFCVALGLSFLYLWFLEIGKALGNAGELSPWIAAWLPNVVFLGLAGWWIKRVDV